MNDKDHSANSHFIVFCLESYKNHTGLDGTAVADLFVKYEVVDYLTEGYDVLHSLGEAALVEDIDEFIRRRA